MCYCSGEFEQVNSDWLISYVFKCMVESMWKQKHLCIQFVINNVSPQGNVKIKLILKRKKLAEIAAIICFGINDNHQDFV